LSLRCPDASKLAWGAKKETKDSFLGFFFCFFHMATNHLLFAPQTAKFAVVGISESAQTSSANGGSEPSTHLHQLQPIHNSLFAPSAASLTRDFRFLEEKL
jgi:hypothetical protein